MKQIASVSVVGVLVPVASFVACSQTPNSPVAASDIRKAFDQAGIEKIAVSQDRAQGVVSRARELPPVVG